MTPLPHRIRSYFDSRGWQVHPHQAALFEARHAPSVLLIAPTGGGKTLAGFLPTLAELFAAMSGGAADEAPERGRRTAGDGTPAGLHTLYISPLKALAADIRRNLSTPIAELGLRVRVEDRTGDTPQSQRQRQRIDPPHILLTTPESLALMLSYPDAERVFSTLQRVVVDEIHALAESRRGDQLMLALATLQRISPRMRRVGLSATVEDPAAIGTFLAPHPVTTRIITADPGPDPDISILDTEVPPPWNTANARHAVPAVLEAVKGARTTLIFINTRALAEIFFHELWLANTDGLPIALHHGSLSRETRERVEAAMLRGELRAIVCTGTLDLGLDWGDVDLVIQVGAPKNIKRLVQRIGRANHRYNAPSRALLVPANRFEVVECRAALEAVRAGALDGEPRGPGPRDVLCQHILIRACAGPFHADALFAEITTAGPYAALSRTAFDACLDYCATGGYALRAYDRWQRLQQAPDGTWRLRDPRATRAIRMNIGTITDTETLPVRLKGRRGGAPLGEVEEAFAATLTPGDTFLIGGEVVRYEGLREMVVQVTREATRKPRIAVYAGTKFANSTVLSDRVLALLQRRDWPELPAHTRDWLHLQRRISRMPRRDVLLVERFGRDDMHHACLYGFAGRNALQTLGLLLTRAMEEAGQDPMGFVSNDYALLIWSLRPLERIETFLAPDALGTGFESWLRGNAVMKRTFRNVATVACLIEKQLPGHRKSGRQATFSTDILYDTLNRYDPDHLLLQITREEAMRGLVDFGRIEEMLTRIGHRFEIVDAPHVTPLAAPLLMEVGKVPIRGRGEARAAEEEARRLMQEAGLGA